MYDAHIASYATFLMRRFFLSSVYITVIAGDLNCAPNCRLDREPSHISNDQGCIELNELMKTFDLDDIFRKRYPDKKSFTFKRAAS